MEKVPRDGNLNRMSGRPGSRCDRVARVPRRGGRALVKLYRLTLSPLIGFHCRYLPTCSDYADQALERHGLWAGGWMTLARLMRCHPWGNSGLDFVPDVPPRTRAGICRGATAAGAEPTAPCPVMAGAQLSNFRFRSRMTVVNSRMSSSICLRHRSGRARARLEAHGVERLDRRLGVKRRGQRFAELGDDRGRRALRRHQRRSSRAPRNP